jgi:formamidopyrimidine-DNA glycosylase
MPEGPEILYSSIIIKKIINNYNFVDIVPVNKNQVSIPIKICNIIVDKEKLKVINVDCKGKLLWIELHNGDNNIFIHIHHYLKGWLHDVEPENYVNYILKFKKGNTKTKNLYMQDKLKLNKILFLTKNDHNIAIKKLGIDIFSNEFTLENFKTKILSKRSLLANFLLDQHIMCGIGNYIKNDAMYLAKINIYSKTCGLTAQQIYDLYYAILFVAYSKLITHKHNAIKYLPINKQLNIPNTLELPYEYKVYDKKETIDGKKILKFNVSGRGSFTTIEYSNIDDVSKCSKTKKKSIN